MPGGSWEVEMNAVYQLKHRIQKLSTMDICDILLTIGLSLLVLGRFLDPQSAVRIVMHIVGTVIILIGMAVFVAITRSVLDY
jgi:hypothetical protein